MYKKRPCQNQRCFDTASLTLYFDFEEKVCFQRNILFNGYSIFKGILCFQRKIPLKILSVIGFSEIEFLILVFLLFGEFITVAEVASITESWNNVGLFVEDGVNRCNP